MQSAFLTDSSSRYWAEIPQQPEISSSEIKKKFGYLLHSVDQISVTLTETDSKAIHNLITGGGRRKRFKHTVTKKVF